MNATFFVGRENQTFSYEQLERDISNWRPTPFVQSACYYEVFVAVLGAVRHRLALQIIPESENQFPRVDSSVETPSSSSSTEEVRGGQIGIFTSGTQGRPKLVWHRANSLKRFVKTGSEHASDIWGLCYPASSFAGLQVFFQAYENRNTLVQLHDIAHHSVAEAIEDHKVTHLSSTPTFARLLCGQSSKLEHVRAYTLGGEIATNELCAKLTQKFPNAKIRNIYASTEAGALLSSPSGDFTVPERLSEKLRVRDSELYIHRSLLADSLESGDLQDDFYASGDLVDVISLSPLRFRFQGRRGDWINVGGTKVNPHRVEAELLAIEAVQDARVFGMPNSVLGNIVSAEIQLKGQHEITAPVIKSLLAKRLTRLEIPQVISFVQELSTSRTGKKNGRRDQVENTSALGEKEN